MRTIRTAAETLAGQLEARYGSGEAASITRIVFEDALDIRNLKRQNQLTEEQAARLDEIGRRLQKGEPLQYVLGQADFYGLKFGVSPAVLIPRQETEELVHWILEEEPRGPISLLDIGTGSGCIPVTLKLKRTEWQIAGVDISPQALEIAKSNAQAFQVTVEWCRMDALAAEAWEELPRQDIIVSNPPYIPPSEARLMPDHVLSHEPRAALFTDTEDALVFYRMIAWSAQQLLSPGGRLYFELNEFNALQVQGLVKQAGFHRVELRRDLNGKYRMLRAEKH